MTIKRICGKKSIYWKIWNTYNPEDKICTGDGYVIHHKNQNPFDNNINNLEKMTHNEHAYLHHIGTHLSRKTKKKLSIINTGCKHPRWGKHLSEEHKRKIGDSQMGEKNHNYGKVASKDTREKMSKKQRGSNHHMWGKHHSVKTRMKLSLSRKGFKNHRSKKVMVEFQIFSSITSAARAFGISVDAITYRIKKCKSGYLYI